MVLLLYSAQCSLSRTKILLPPPPRRGKLAIVGLLLKAAAPSA